MIRRIEIKDAEEIKDIYNHYIQNTIITFEESPIDIVEMTKRIKTTLEHYPWLVYADYSKIIGYAYASPWNPRSAYKNSVESTIYLHPKEQRKGIGTQLYSKLIEELNELNIHTIIGVIALPNNGSVALHEKLGFQKAGHFKKIGNKFGKWIDVGYWQLIKE